jgi:hypothetical protein
MKKRILLTVSVLLIFGLAVVAFAYNQTSSSVEKAACCCCSGDSCPMKKDKASACETASCCDHDNCCCENGGDSCPMKMKGETQAAMQHSDAEKDGCCPCCGKDKSA